jgi:hypothetical protein
MVFVPVLQADPMDHTLFLQCGQTSAIRRGVDEQTGVLNQKGVAIRIRACPSTGVNAIGFSLFFSVNEVVMIRIVYDDFLKAAIKARSKVFISWIF